ncbi:pyrophosphatase PpaX [Texcoconibacillus texcoconensis]|uniref:pyrophosphatase PpaX n=1 Tax=Texcoconibacillus texcoconensis TaxID=1095777 RepID=UPI0016129EAA
MFKDVDTLLFDLDGTLVNTVELIISSFLHTLDQFKPGEYTREDAISFIGPQLADTFQRIDPERAKEMEHVYRTYNHEKHDELVEEYEGVYETVERLYQEGYKMAIVTTKRRETAERGLKLSRLERFFDVTITLDDVEEVKPATEPLDKALTQLGSSRVSALMIGDSKHDILGGQNANTYTAGVAWTIQGKDKLASYKPDVMLETMPELLTHLGVEET